MSPSFVKVWTKGYNRLFNGAKLFPNLKIWDTNTGEIDSPIEQHNNYVIETWLFHLNW